MATLSVIGGMVLGAGLLVTLDYLADLTFRRPSRETWDHTDQLPALGRALTREK